MGMLLIFAAVTFLAFGMSLWCAWNVAHPPLAWRSDALRGRRRAEALYTFAFSASCLLCLGTAAIFLFQ